MPRDVPLPSPSPLPQPRDRMPAPDNRPIQQLWDVHWSIVAQHVQCKKQKQ